MLFIAELHKTCLQICSNFGKIKPCLITKLSLFIVILLYFFGYKTVFSFQNNPKNLDPSYKMDLDLWDCLGRVKLVF